MTPNKKWLLLTGISLTATCVLQSVIFYSRTYGRLVGACSLWLAWMGLAWFLAKRADRENEDARVRENATLEASRIQREAQLEAEVARRRDSRPQFGTPEWYDALNREIQEERARFPDDARPSRGPLIL